MGMSQAAAAVHNDLSLPPQQSAEALDNDSGMSQEGCEGEGQMTQDAQPPLVGSVHCYISFWFLLWCMYPDSLLPALLAGHAMLRPML